MFCCVCVLWRVEGGGVEGGSVEGGSVEGGSVGVRLTSLVGNFCIFSQASICCTCMCCHLER